MLLGANDDIDPLFIHDFEKFRNLAGRQIEIGVEKDNMSSAGNFEASPQGSAFTDIPG